MQWKQSSKCKINGLTGHWKLPRQSWIPAWGSRRCRGLWWQRKPPDKACRWPAQQISNCYRWPYLRLVSGNVWQWTAPLPRVWPALALCCLLISWDLWRGASPPPRLLVHQGVWRWHLLSDFSSGHRCRWWARGLGHSHGAPCWSGFYMEPWRYWLRTRAPHQASSYTKPRHTSWAGTHGSLGIRQL